jgi:hypothetical protein
MALVKFGQQTLNIDGVPDGHILVSESEVSQLRQVKDAYALLKRNIPIDVEEGQLASFVERGRRYDDVEKSRKDLETHSKSLEEKLQKLGKLPEGFSQERWNKYVQREQDEIFQSKIDTLTQKVYEKVQKELGVKVSIDPRFIDPSKLDSFNPDDPKAEETWYQILDEAHTAQESFVKSQVSELTPSTPSGITPQTTGTPVSSVHSPGSPMPGDKITDNGAVAGAFGRRQ